MSRSIECHRKQTESTKLKKASRSSVLFGLAVKLELSRKCSTHFSLHFTAIFRHFRVFQIAFLGFIFLLFRALGIIYRAGIEKSSKIVFVVCAAWRGQNSRVLKYCLLLFVNYGDSLVAYFTPLYTVLLSHQPTAMPAEQQKNSKQTD